MDCVDQNGVAGTRVVLLFARGVGAAFEETLVVILVVGFVETSREAKVGELDVAIFINEDVVGFDITDKENKLLEPKIVEGLLCLPMDEPQFVDSFNRTDALRHIEPRDVLREDLILDQHRH